MKTIGSYLVGTTTLLLSLSVHCDAANDNMIMLEDFATAPSSSSHTWKETNDPVMGGQSTGSFTKENGIGHFVGHVAIVPFLQAPGFIKAETLKGEETWPDVSSCVGLEFAVESHNNYSGFRVSFGKNRPKDAMPYTYGYKANLKVASSTITSSSSSWSVSVVRDVSMIQIPFTKFTDKWDAGTGDATTTCEEDEQYCPDEATLRDLYSISIMGEGVEGEVDLDLHSIQAYGCSSEAAAAAAKQKEEVEEVEESEISAVQEEKEEEKLMEEVTEEVTEEEEESENNLSSEDAIVLEDFANPTNTWTAMNDPVMGGQSTSSVKIEDGVAKFNGEVKIVPFLKAPGFVTMVTGGYRSKASTFPDVSGCDGLKVVLRSTKKDEEVDDYTGYRISFGNHREPDGRYAMGYKAPAFTNVPTGDDFGEIVFPFNTFSAKWNDGTGDITVPCSDQNPQYCPDTATLQNMETLSFWGEGVAGEVTLEIKSISAVGCTAATTTTVKKSTFFLTEGNSNNNNKKESTMMVIIGGLATTGLVIGVVAWMYLSNRRQIEGTGGTYATLEGESQIV